MWLHLHHHKTIVSKFGTTSQCGCQGHVRPLLHYEVADILQHLVGE